MAAGREADTFAPLAAAPPPAAKEAARLRQIKEIARRFTAHEFWDPENSRFELRLLVQPVHRYRDAAGEIQDGAMFVLAHGTNPEAMLADRGCRPDYGEGSLAVWTGANEQRRDCTPSWTARKSGCSRGPKAARRSGLIPTLSFRSPPRKQRLCPRGRSRRRRDPPKIIGLPAYRVGGDRGSASFPLATCSTFGQEEKKPDAGQDSESLLTQAKEHMERFEMRRSSEDEEVQLHPRPLLTYGDSARVNKDGTLWAFGA